MLKTPLLIALAPIAVLASACTSSGTQTSLSAIAATSVSVTTANDTSSLAISPTPIVDITFPQPSVPGNPQPSDCLVLGSDLTATFDGSAMEVTSLGGYHNQALDGASCEPFELGLTNATPHPGAESTLVLHDASATWTIAGMDLLTDDLALMTGVSAGSSTTVAWPSARTIDDAYARLASGPNGSNVETETTTTVGDAIMFTPTAPTSGAATLAISAQRAATPSECDGPTGGCTIGVIAGANFAVVVQ